MTYDNLDPSNYETSSGLAVDAMMLKNGAQPDLITDVDMLN